MHNILRNAQSVGLCMALWVNTWQQVDYSKSLSTQVTQSIKFTTEWEDEWDISRGISLWSELITYNGGPATMSFKYEIFLDPKISRLDIKVFKSQFKNIQNFSGNFYKN